MTTLVGSAQRYGFRILWTLLLLSLGSSCSHYQLGRPQNQTQASNGIAQGSTLVWVAPIRLVDSIADVAIPLNREIREQLIRDTAFGISESSSTTDVQLWVSLAFKDKESLARQEDDTGISNVMGIKLVAIYELTSASGNSIKSGEVEVQGQIFRQSGFNESSRQRMPSLLRDLAGDILQDAFMQW